MLGKTINGYAIEDFVGAGHFGEVYKASKGGSIFAIKFIRKDFMYKEMQDERFRREVQALSRVKSKHTVQVYEDGEYIEGKTPYRMIVMDYIEGETLRDIRNNNSKPWDVEKALSLIIEILKGLKDIHSVGIIHRDLKPENIKISPKGEVKILDFGLSKIIDYSTITQTGKPLGTFFYMSPELVKGERPIQSGSDYYSIGVILFELLTGKILFYPATDVEIIYKTINVRPPNPTTINPKIPNHIENVVLKLLSKEVFKRYSSVDEIINDLSKKESAGEQIKIEKAKYYIRVIPNDTAILQDYLQKHELDGVDFPINIHMQCKTLLPLLRKRNDSMDFIADPGTNRMAYTNFLKTKGLRELPYAPQGYDALTPDDLNDRSKVQEFVKKVIELQIANGCNILSAPFFYFENTADDWFNVNLKLLRESIDYVRVKYPQYEVAGSICTQAELLCRQKERNAIIENFSHCKTNFMQFFIDKIHEDVNEAQLYNFILTARSIKDFSKTKIIACRVPSIALSLLTIGFDAISSGLGVIDSFTKDIIVKEEENIRMPTKHYFPDLLTSVTLGPKNRTFQDIVSHEKELKAAFPHFGINLACNCDGCNHKILSANFQRPRLHFLLSIKKDMETVNTANSQGKGKSYMLHRMEKAYILQKKLIDYGVKLDSPMYCQTWKEIVGKF